jgi:hypothetical protein
MDKYAKIKELNLQVFWAGRALREDTFVVDADSLLEVLDKGVDFYLTEQVSNTNDYVGQSWCYSKNEHPATHKGTVVGIKPTAKPEPVSKEEIDSFIGYYNKQHTGPIDLESAIELLKKISANGINKVGLK